MSGYPFKFAKVEGRLVGRVNRFVVEVELGGRKVEAYLPNPGRLWELLLPGTELLLSPDLSAGKLPCTVLACRKEGRWVLLHTHLANRIVRSLIDEGRLECFRGYEVLKEEPAFGRRRFDLLLGHAKSGESYYLEIKSCTLFAGRLAMFPDAVTVRGTEHLYSLKELSAGGVRTGCLFVVMSPDVGLFVPAYHVDQAFARAFSEVRDAVQLKAVALGFDDDFKAVSTIGRVDIAFDLLDRELADRGAYLLLAGLDSAKALTVGSLGQIRFERGWYVYTGSAMRGLSGRIARHARKKKSRHWHIDNLTAAADALVPVPIVSSERLECALAAGLQGLAGPPVSGFGSSDCSCPGHLFYFAENPLHNPRFIALLQHYRIRRLENMLPEARG